MQDHSEGYQAPILPIHSGTSEPVGEDSATMPNPGVCVMLALTGLGSNVNAPNPNPGVCFMGSPVGIAIGESWQPKGDPACALNGLFGCAVPTRVPNHASPTGVAESPTMQNPRFIVLMDVLVLV